MIYRIGFCLVFPVALPLILIGKAFAAVLDWLYDNAYSPQEGNSWEEPKA